MKKYFSEELCRGLYKAPVFGLHGFNRRLVPGIFEKECYVYFSTDVVFVHTGEMQKTNLATKKSTDLTGVHNRPLKNKPCVPHCRSLG